MSSENILTKGKVTEKLAEAERWLGNWALSDAAFRPEWNPAQDIVDELAFLRDKVQRLTGKATETTIVSSENLEDVSMNKSEAVELIGKIVDDHVFNEADFAFFLNHMRCLGWHKLHGDNKGLGCSCTCVLGHTQKEWGETQMRQGALRPKTCPGATCENDNSRIMKIFEEAHYCQRRSLTAKTAICSTIKRTLPEGSPLDTAIEIIESLWLTCDQLELLILAREPVSTFSRFSANSQTEVATARAESCENGRIISDAQIQNEPPAPAQGEASREGET
jgi:hypothetical protein